MGAGIGSAPTEGLAVETLLGREVIDVGGGDFAEYLADTTVLVTGAGGSIGAELCARLTGLGARELVLVDHAEAPLAGLATALRYELGFARAIPVLADIKSRMRMVEVFERHRPNVVFHAAAYKQVPLLESSPVEGVATNVLGTKYVVDAARDVGVERLVLFSTDKAVQPTNILGQTKAVAEWIVATTGAEAVCGRYASVRLGNVINSTGSILPAFRRQIARGGPVTVTHPQATRYLMTAGEAAGLATVAGALADSNSVFWLYVGPPVCVADLAQRLVSATSEEVSVDFVGLRPGERLHERLFSSEGEIATTPCDHVWSSTMDNVDRAWLNGMLEVLARHVKHASGPELRAALAEMHAAPERDAVPPTAVVAR